MLPLLDQLDTDMTVALPTDQMPDATVEGNAANHWIHTDTRTYSASLKRGINVHYWIGWSAA